MVGGGNLKVEFILKDKDGVELNEGDNVLWVCENVIDKPSFFGMIDCMWNSGQVIPGKLVFRGDVPKLYFLSDDEETRWIIDDLGDDFRHPRLKYMEE